MGMRRVITSLLLLTPLALWGQKNTPLEKEVNHELTMLPYYGVFDNIAYKVEGREVTLVGQVRQPRLKTDAEKAVKSIEGVETVENNIEVLPNSPQDDRIRLAAYNAIYSQPALQRYQLMAVPSIHILVKNGDVELHGEVTSQVDKTAAETAVNSITGVHKVTNNLRLSGRSD
jgi:hyperosmotically inducible periplasmic protein